mmetsp:Transcript_27569/g.67041  ORF Transcript_27569/g.67041 Transcript_27569/m.67041 type:complete len:747 (-) Transcript_27569:31-2271(-)
MSLNKNAKSQDEEDERSFNKKDFRLLWTMLLFFLVSACVYLTDGQKAETETVQMVVHKSNNLTASLTLAPKETPTSEQNTASSSSSSSGGGDFDKGCSDMCTKREASRKEKFGGDLLDFQDIVRLAEGGHEKVISTLRQDYGEYFDRMFINVNGTTKDGGTAYFGMRPADLGGPSRGRMKRKMKIKVLKMMASVRATEINLHGCDCVGKTGSVNSEVDKSLLNDIPDFFEKYVFANGGHSNAAGHGNMYSEAYTAVFGRDVRPLWEAIGIEMIDRNYAMGAMSSNPFMSTCVKEVFGTDVDFLSWNYGMTDGKTYSAAHYIYRGAMLPSRPAFVFVDWMPGAGLGRSFVEVGLSMFRSRLDGNPVANLPEMTPDGIPISDQEAQKIPKMARNLKCNRRLEGKDLCFGNKWSCNEKIQADGVDCICPHIGKRSSWHMGYKAHALQGHMLALPFIQMLLEALRELAATRTTTDDSEQLLADLQEQEDADFKLFMESPLLDVLSTAYETLGEKTDPLYETWFRGPSICRTSYLPSQSRFLGLMTDSGKTGNVAIYTHEIYDTGDFEASGRDANGSFVYLDDATPPAGKFSLVANKEERAGFKDIKSHEAECPAIVMPDYKDVFYAPVLDGKASFTFPNKKEKEYYGYDPKLFKGVIALMLPLFEIKCKKCTHSYDLTLADFLEHNVTMTVNSKPVKSIRVVRGKAMILQGDNENPYWEPALQTEDYTIEFQVVPDAAQYNMRLTHFILM